LNEQRQLFFFIYFFVKNCVECMQYKMTA